MLVYQSTFPSFGRMSKNPFCCPSIHLSIPLSVHPSITLSVLPSLHLSCVLLLLSTHDKGNDIWNAISNKAQLYFLIAWTQLNKSLLVVHPSVCPSVTLIKYQSKDYSICVAASADLHATDAIVSTALNFPRISIRGSVGPLVHGFIRPWVH